MRVREKLAWSLLASIGLLVVAAVTSVVSGGPLDPPGPPASTMKTLDHVPPSWDQTLSALGGCASLRFTCVMAGAAVLDKETGLVWETAPSSSTGSWFVAVNACNGKSLDGREGWRLPTIDELLSLLDPTMLAPSTSLPPGHPFSGVVSGGYWSITTNPSLTTNAFVVRFISTILGSPGGFANGDKSGSPGMAWCVRGGRGFDGM